MAAAHAPLAAERAPDARPRGSSAKRTQIQTVPHPGLSPSTENRYAQAADFRAALRRFLRHSEQCARRYGLTPRQHQILLQIAGSPKGIATISDLVVRLASTQSTVTELAQRAEAAGLIKRRSSAEDGRVVELSLTAAGRRKLDRVHDALGPERARLQELVNNLPEPGSPGA